MTRRLAAELVSRGHTVAVATNQYPRTLPHFERIDGISIYRQLYPNVLPKSSEVGTWQRFKAVLLIPLAPFALLRLLILIRRVRPEVINAHYFSYPVAFVLIAARMLRIPTVLSFHGSDLSTVPYPANYAYSLHVACRLARAFTTCSRDLWVYLEPLLSSSQRSRACVVYHGVDEPTTVRRPTVVQGPYILAVGRLVEKKGIEVLIRSAVTVHEQLRNVRVVVVGDGPLRGQLEELAQELNIAASVTFLGSVDPAAVSQLMRESCFVVVPSQCEGFGMVCLEAMVSSKAVVASRVGGIPEIVVDGETGILVPPDNPAALASAIDLLLQNPSRADAMGRRGCERALHAFTWDRTVGGYLEAYRCALECV